MWSDEISHVVLQSRNQYHLFYYYVGRYDGGLANRTICFAK